VRTVMPFVRDGRLRAVAVIGPERAPALPEVPTVAESGLPGFEANNWIALFGPAGMPADVTDKLNAAVLKIMRSPDIQKRLETEGARFVAMSPKELSAFVRDQSEKWGKLLKETGSTPQ
jgi:tripartite-type tricarboxylate transporter receptor subunit TctC